MFIADMNLLLTDKQQWRPYTTWSHRANQYYRWYSKTSLHCIRTQKSM